LYAFLFSPTCPSRPNILFSTLFLKTSVYTVHLMWQTNFTLFYTHIPNKVI
jgi:hypothetical protein